MIIILVILKMIQKYIVIIIEGKACDIKEYLTIIDQSTADGFSKGNITAYRKS